MHAKDYILPENLNWSLLEISIGFLLSFFYGTVQVCRLKDIRGKSAGNVQVNNQAAPKCRLISLEGAFTSGVRKERNRYRELSSVVPKTLCWTSG